MVAAAAAAALSILFGWCCRGSWKCRVKDSSRGFFCVLLGGWVNGGSESRSGRAKWWKGLGGKMLGLISVERTK